MTVRCTDGQHRIETESQFCVDCRSPLRALVDGRARVVQQSGQRPYIAEVIPAGSDLRGLDAQPGRIIETHLRGSDIA